MNATNMIDGIWELRRGAATECDGVAADARHTRHLGPAERACIFIGLASTLEKVLAHLPPGERTRRRRAAAVADPRPTPWWRNMRHSAWPTSDVIS